MLRNCAGQGWPGLSWRIRVDHRPRAIKEREGSSFVEDPLCGGGGGVVELEGAKHGDTTAEVRDPTDQLRRGGARRCPVE